MDPRVGAAEPAACGPKCQQPPSVLELDAERAMMLPDPHRSLITGAKAQTSRVAASRAVSYSNLAEIRKRLVIVLT
jgi:hypothetical protein